MQPFDTPPHEPRYLVEPPYVSNAGPVPEPVVARSSGRPRRGVVVALSLLAVAGFVAAAIAFVARSSARSDADAAETEASGLVVDLAERDTTIDSLRVVVDGHHDEVARLEDQLDADESVIDEMQTRVDNAESRLAAAEDELARATEGRSDDPNTSASLPTANDGVITPMEVAVLDTVVAGQEEGLSLSIAEYNAIARRVCAAAGPWDVQGEVEDFADTYDVTLMSASILIGTIAGMACLDVLVTMVGS